MSKLDEIRDKVTNPKKPTAAGKLMGEEDDVKDEIAVTNEEPENNNDLDESIAKAFPANDKGSKKREKVLKGIYLDSDILEAYNKAAEVNKRGWGSQLVSDLLRKEFIRLGIKVDPE